MVAPSPHGHGTAVNTGASKDWRKHALGGSMVAADLKTVLTAWSDAKDELKRRTDAQFVHSKDVKAVHDSAVSRETKAEEEETKGEEGKEETKAEETAEAGDEAPPTPAKGGD